MILTCYHHLAVRSYYSLGFMGQDSHTEESQYIGEDSCCKADTSPNNGLQVEDYSKIIEELQSHRKEIEKLQMDMNSSTPTVTNSSAPTVAPLESSCKKSQLARVINNEFFPFCPLKEIQQHLNGMTINDEEGASRGESDEGKDEYVTAEDINTAADQGFSLMTKVAWLLVASSSDPISLSYMFFC